MSAWKQFRAMLAAHLKMTLREKQVWFWAIFFPIILMVLFMIIFGGGGDDRFQAKVAVVKPAANATADLLEDQLRKVPVFEWKSEKPVSAEQADEWIKEKDIDAFIELPETGNAKALKLIVNTENEQSATTQAISGILEKFVQQANLAEAGIDEQSAYRLEVRSVSNGSEDLDYVDFLLTGMIALSIAQGGLFGMVDLVEMRRNGLLKRLRMTPVRIGLFGLSDMTVRYLFGIVQMVILALIGVYGFGANLHIDFLTLFIAFSMGMLAFSAIGYLFSSFSKSLESYMGLANIASFLMMFLSGIFFSTAGLPDWLQPVTHALPLTYFVEGIRDGLAYGSGIGTSDFWAGVGILALWGAGAFSLGSFIYKRGKEATR